MHRVFGSLIMGALLVYGTLYAWNHRPKPEPVSVSPEPTPAAESKNDTRPQDQPYVTVVGPLAKLVPNQAAPEAEQPRPSERPTVEDHVDDSPVGTSSRVVQKTFSLTHIAQFPFEIPAHAAMPHLHGTFRSFVQQQGSFSNDSANVELLLLSEEQYAQLSAGRETDTIFVADASHYQDMNFDLSPTQDHPVKYHLVFRSAPGGAPKKVVQADFVVDF